MIFSVVAGDQKNEQPRNVVENELHGRNVSFNEQEGV
jgi:hypothetical protein